MKYFIGCSGFHYKDWRDEFYPPDLPHNKWLFYYARYFNTVELNVTFYRFPGPALLGRLYDESPGNFSFSVKVPRMITHYMQFRETEGMLARFYEVCSESLKEKLGPILFQLPASMKNNSETLARFIGQVNPFYENVIEFRDNSWFNKEVFDSLADADIAVSGVSFSGLPENVIATTPTIYYRFHGVPVLYYSEVGPEKLMDFAQQIKNTKADFAYIYFNNTALKSALHDAILLKELLEGID